MTLSKDSGLVLARLPRNQAQKWRSSVEIDAHGVLQTENMSMDISKGERSSRRAASL